MASVPAEPVWLTEDYQVSWTELVECSGMSEAELNELVEYGAIEPMDAGAAPWAFQGRCLQTARAAVRLRSAFDLEPHALALVVGLLQRIRELEQELRAARALRSP